MQEKKQRMTADYIYDLLKEMVFDWRLTPGQKINISHLSKELNISSIPLREALSRLHSTKLVQFEPNKGYKVSEILDDMEMLQLMEARTLIEKHAVTDIIRKNSLEIIDQLSKITEEMMNLDLENSYKKVLTFVHLDQQFHSLILKAANNIFLSEAYEGMYSHFHIARFYRVRGGVDQLEATAEHREIIEAIKIRDVFRAETAVANHIKDAKGRLLERSQEKILTY